mmetsp:Transcript_21193/g.35544  ORF Transcript_21193/g.35544 Transcript_21193/m.35544 type:complete len:141 (-) Transcript_21193:137-559(-)
MALEDNQKIGIGLICLGLIFVVLGVLLFFDSSLIAIGNVLFLAGLCFAIGFKRTANLFTRHDRIRGTVCFFLGIALVLMKWGMIGMLVEGFGFLNLFGNFLPTVLSVARQLPILSTLLDMPIVSQTADFIAGKTRPKYSV